MAAEQNISRLEEDVGPPQLLLTAKEREGQRKRESVIACSKWASFWAVVVGY